MLDVIRSVKQIFTLWIFCWRLPVWLLICLESYWLSCWDLFLRKHRLFLGINKTDHVFCSSLQSKYVPCPHWAPLPWLLCSSLQKRKEDSQRCQLGHGFSSSCQVGVNDTDKKEILAIEHGYYFLLCSSCRRNECGLHDGLGNRAFYQHHRA